MKLGSQETVPSPASGPHRGARGRPKGSSRTTGVEPVAARVLPTCPRPRQAAQGRPCRRKLRAAVYRVAKHRQPFIVAPLTASRYLNRASAFLPA